DSRTTGRGSRANRQSQENCSTRGSLVRTNQAPTDPNSKEVLATTIKTILRQLHIDSSLTLASGCNVTPCNTIPDMPSEWNLHYARGSLRMENPTVTSANLLSGSRSSFG